MKILIDGPDQMLYQWDTGQRLKLMDIPGNIIVDLARCGESRAVPCDVYAEAGNVYCDIPDALLTEARMLTAYVRRVETDGEETILSRPLVVLSKPKPDDYVHTETEVLCYRDLDHRVGELEKKAAAASFSVTTDGDALVISTGMCVRADGDAIILGGAENAV